MELATTTNTDGTYDNADLSQHSTLNKRYAFSAVTNSTPHIVTGKQIGRAHV